MNKTIFIGFFLVVIQFIAAADEFTRQQYIFSYPERQVIQNANDNDTNIEIIGWARNGLLAYREYYFVDGIPGDKYSFKIFNTINDQYLIDECVYLIHGELSSIQTMEDEFIRFSHVNDLRQRWNDLLKEYGFNNEIENPIGNIRHITYDRFPYNDFECWFNYSTTGIHFYYDDINWELIVSNGRSQKTISHGQTEGWRLTGSKILGYLKSPYENRIAVIVISHAPRHISDAFFYAEIYGCNLDVGFD